MAENAIGAKRYVVRVRHTEFCCQAIPALLAGGTVDLVSWLDGFDQQWREKLKPKERGWLEQWEDDCRRNWQEKGWPNLGGNWLDHAYEIIEAYAPSGHLLYPLWGSWGYWRDAGNPVATLAAIRQHAKRHPALYGAVGGAGAMLTVIETVYR